MKIKQTANIEITLRRFDTGENITLKKDIVVDLDEKTAAYLLSFKSKDKDGNDVANFVVAE